MAGNPYQAMLEGAQLLQQGVAGGMATASDWKRRKAEEVARQAALEQEKLLTEKQLEQQKLLAQQQQEYLKSINPDVSIQLSEAEKNRKLEWDKLMAQLNAQRAMMQGGGQGGKEKAIINGQLQPAAVTQFFGEKFASAFKLNPMNMWGWLGGISKDSPEYQNFIKTAADYITLAYDTSGMTSEQVRKLIDDYLQSALKNPESQKTISSQSTGTSPNFFQALSSLFNPQQAMGSEGEVKPAIPKTVSAPAYGTQPVPGLEMYEDPSKYTPKQKQDIINNVFIPKMKELNQQLLVVKQKMASDKSYATVGSAVMEDIQKQLAKIQELIKKYQA